MGVNNHQVWDQTKKQTVFIFIMMFISILICPYNSFADNPETVSAKDSIILIPSHIYGADDRGMYSSDPVSWLRNGYQGLLFDLNFSVRSHGFDQNGYKMSEIISYIINSLGLSGEMFIFNSAHKCQKAIIQRPRIMRDTDYRVNIKAGFASQTILIHVVPANCDTRGCHTVAPPRHILEKKSSDSVKSRCGNCHGHLSDAIKGAFKIRSQRGLPRCDDCHEDKAYSYPKGNTFRNSYGHGGVACVNCHASTHLANHTSVGYNACASDCHTTKPYDSNMVLIAVNAIIHQ